MPPLLALNAVPFFLLGLMLVYVVGFSLQWLPLYGGYTAGAIPQWSLSFAIDVVRHAILPSLAIILGSIGGWALGMRAMMVTNPGRGLRRLRRGEGPAAPHHLLSTTGCATPCCRRRPRWLSSSGNWSPAPCWSRSSSAIPASARCSSRAIKGSDFFLVQGIVFILIIAIGLATLILDLVYPLLDPRIVYRRA